MGGYSYSPPPAPRPEELLRNELASFFRAKTKESQLTHLEKALKIYEKKNITSSFLNNLESAGNTKIVMGLENIEIEYKLNVPTNSAKLEKTLLSYKTKNISRFFKDENVHLSEGINTYFGTQNEERFIVIKNDHGYHLKIKSQTIEAYNFGLAGEEYVLKRTELLKKISSNDFDLLEVANLIVDECNPTEVNNLGDVNKTKATQFALEKNTGRIYSIVLSKSSTNGRPNLFQLECEYAGYVPGFLGVKKSEVEKEKEIVKDILDLGGEFAEQYKLSPTTLTKFDWLMGNEEKFTERKTTSTKTKGQSFFDESI